MSQFLTRHVCTVEANLRQIIEQGILVDFTCLVGEGVFYILVSKFNKIWFSLGGWVGFLWFSSVENALKDLDPGIHAMWLWANVLLFGKCQGVFFQKSVDT